MFRSFFVYFIRIGRAAWRRRFFCACFSEKRQRVLIHPVYSLGSGNGMH